MPVAATAGMPCPRPNCTGAIDPDGYCDECGRAVPASGLAPAAPTAPAGPAAPAGAGSTASRRPPDPRDAILADPQVPEHRRFCTNPSCRRPVGRSRDGQPGRSEGFCVACRTPFSFSPKLVPGDLVSDQYEVLGCINFGGLGWIYLARDRNVVERHVVLKGLINTSDADGQDAMREELKVLAEVNHPSIVTVHNFVKHPDRHSDTTIGYIVEEYVAGQSLKDLRLGNRQPQDRPGASKAASGPLPLRQVIECALEILPALGYLHNCGLLYCDFKPDNLIQSDGRLKLVDLGAVRDIDDGHSPIYGTHGYQAPEVARGLPPSVGSDLYTVGRTMAVLSFDAEFATTHAEALPEPDEVGLLRQHDSFYRLLRRATDPDPQRRFASAEEMADQLDGVLREVRAVEEGEPQPGSSAVFGPEARASGPNTGDLLHPEAPAATAAMALPVPQVNPADAAAGLLASLNTSDPAEVVERLRAVPSTRATVELRLRLARALIELGDFPAAAEELDGLEGDAPGDWRVGWYRGVAALAADRPAEAHSAFDVTCDWLPGEAAPKLALAVAGERAGYPGASAYYERVWRTDHSYVSAAFGLARTRLACGDRDTAIAALDAVPQGSPLHIAAGMAAIHALLGDPAKVSEADLVDADERIERLGPDAEQRERLSIELLEAALRWVNDGRPGRGSVGAHRDGWVRGRRLRERDLRLGLEDCYRTLARLAERHEQRYAWVDKANAIRPRTRV